MPRRAHACAALLGALALLGGCDRDERRAPDAEADPAIAAALSDPIMSDPDLAGQDRSGDAVTVTSSRIALPPEDGPAGSRQR